METLNIRKRITDNAEKLFDKALTMALAGDKMMLKILLPHVLPSSTGSDSAKLRLPNQGISLNRMPELAASLLSQIADGSMSPKTAKEVSEVMGIYLQSHEMVDTEKRMEKLEELTQEVELRRKSGELLNLQWKESLEYRAF